MEAFIPHFSYKRAIPRISRQSNDIIQRSRDESEISAIISFYDNLTRQISENDRASADSSLASIQDSNFMGNIGAYPELFPFSIVPYLICALKPENSRDTTLGSALLLSIYLHSAADRTLSHVEQITTNTLALLRSCENFAPIFPYLNLIFLSLDYETRNSYESASIDLSSIEPLFRLEAWNEAKQPGIVPLIGILSCLSIYRRQPEDAEKSIQLSNELFDKIETNAEAFAFFVQMVINFIEAKAFPADLFNALFLPTKVVPLLFSSSPVSQMNSVILITKLDEIECWPIGIDFQTLLSTGLEAKDDQLAASCLWASSQIILRRRRYCEDITSIIKEINERFADSSFCVKIEEAFLLSAVILISSSEELCDVDIDETCTELCFGIEMAAIEEVAPLILAARKILIGGNVNGIRSCGHGFTMALSSAANHSDKSISDAARSLISLIETPPSDIAMK